MNTIRTTSSRVGPIDPLGLVVSFGCWDTWVCRSYDVQVTSGLERAGTPTAFTIATAPDLVFVSSIACPTHRLRYLGESCAKSTAQSYLLFHGKLQLPEHHSRIYSQVEVEESRERCVPSANQCSCSRLWRKRSSPAE